MDETEKSGLRERKKLATREALSAAALRLAMERGPDNVRVDDIAEAAGVSPRTYNNYFSSREQAIVAAVAAERALRVGAAVRARPDDEPLARAVVEAVVEQYSTVDEPGRAELALITSAPGLRAAFLDTVSAVEQPLAAAIAERAGRDERTAAVLAAAVAAAARVGAERWLRSWVTGNALLVVPGGSLPDLLREALLPLAPALDAPAR
ncbi:TetR/AcrR family transcriptional regulator [Pseudonocardia humida]|uniref:TetR/AcrR family transcriptional regulator n=1 Tax=Pseudonocardia humida TaxID=2800819 RepID=UPI00207D0FFB|nr:TetR/AcrR family transcriptional regulator [Pseudonocardia humida]